jgi:hypothetical protein
VARNVTELQQVLAALATRGGQRLVSYLRLEEVKPPSQLPLEPAVAIPGRPARRARRPATVAATIVGSASGAAKADQPDA